MWDNAFVEYGKIQAEQHLILSKGHIKALQKELLDGKPVSEENFKNMKAVIYN